MNKMLQRQQENKKRATKNLLSVDIFRLSKAAEKAVKNDFSSLGKSSWTNGRYSKH